MKAVFPLFLFALGAIPLAAAEAQVQAQAPQDSTKIPVLSCRAARLTEKVKIDGSLDEHVWQNGNAITEFWQRDPNEGTTPSQRTEVRVAYDDEAIYVGARLHDEAPDSILARLSRRDVSIPADRFSVYLDPLRDKRSGYYFLVNAAGTVFDGTLSNDGWEDSSWDGVWEAKTKVDDKGWTAEMRIPYSQLRFASQGDRMVWGVNFRRVIQRHNEEVFLVYQPKKESGFVSRFPEIGFEGVQAGSSIELLPYATGKVAKYADGEKENDPNGGFDLRMPVGGRLTLNGTINPDFGQVEVDPAVINLSDVETFYPEKRPFFVEGSANFRFGNEGAGDYWGFNWPEPVFFYSRRIGGEGETILGATKMTGKLGTTANLGSMLAVTNDDGNPLTAWGDVGILKEFRGRLTGLGFKVNGAVRDFDEEFDPDGNRLEDLYNKNSLFTGLDGWIFLDSKKKWVISGWSGLSRVEGTEQRIADIQTSSRHYYQRPDADEYRFDPTRTSLTGHGTRLWLNKQSGNIFLNAAAGYMSPGFEVNDIGFMSRADVINMHVGTGYKWTETTKNRKYQDVIAALFTSYDMDGNRQVAGIWAQGTTEFQNNHSWNYRVAYNPGSMSSRRTRGGPLMRTNDGFELGTYYDTDGKSKFFWWVDVGTYQQPVENSYNYFFYPGIELKPASNVTFRFEPGYEQVHENAQYVTAYADPAATETYGARYVFARLNQKTLVAGIRLNVAFSPTTSLQFYGQPLVSIGEYTDYKALARPGSYDFVPLAFLDEDGDGQADDHDFNFKSLRGNAIFRWEYRPGSALFLVWNHGRQNADPTDGRFTFSKSFSSLFEEEADNIFLAKLTYYFTM
jgi:hypothetical protein